MNNYIKTIVSGLLSYINKFRGNWNQNDETAPDYIRNRTHYEEVITKIFLPETNFDYSNDYFWEWDYTYISPINENVEYKIIFDNIEYKCISVNNELDGYNYIGNQSLESQRFDEIIESNEPFLIYNYGIKAQPGKHTINITYLNNEVEEVLLDKEIFIVPIISNESKILSNPLSLDCNYEIKYNEEIYKCSPVIIYRNYFGLGDPSLSSMPFCITYYGVNDYKIVTLDPECTFSINGNYTKVHKIDKKYLPEIRTIYNLVDGKAEGSVRTIGTNSNISYYAFAEGYGTTASGECSHAEGDNTNASNWSSHAEGAYTSASGDTSHAEGYSSEASGNYSHAEGYDTIVSGNHSHAEGCYTQVSGDYSHAEGYGSEASGKYSHAEGYNTIASGKYSHAEGAETIASGKYSHAEGESTEASGHYSHAEGYDTKTSGHDSHAEGYSTIASGQASHAEGSFTEASGECSHAEGLSAIASSIYSHAEGFQTEASGACSHAEGGWTIASGESSHTEGWGTIASGHHSHVQGVFNIEDTENKYAHIVGNGEEDTRSNAHTLDWEGNAWFQGDIYLGGTGQEDYITKVVTEKTISQPRDHISFKDIENNFIYILQMKNGNLVSRRTISGIKITKMPNKLNYTEGEIFNPEGMEVVGYCEDGNIIVINNYTYPKTPISSNIITISYEEAGKTYIENINISISPFNPEEVLIDFYYTTNEDGTYTITDWKGTYNGVSSTKIIVPDNALIKI